MSRNPDEESAIGNYSELDSELSESDIDCLVNPIMDIVKYNYDDEYTRRILFLAWIANLFKPISAMEVAEILDYDYRRVSNILASLERSSVLTIAKDQSAYSQVALQDLTLYLPKNVQLGNRITGRPPKLYVFRARSKVDMDKFIVKFNQNNHAFWSRIVSKAFRLVDQLDPTYRLKLVGDYYFLMGRITPLLRALRDDGIISVKKTPTGETVVDVKWRRNTATYALPASRPLDKLF
jgi:hypothetical protein